MQRLTPQRNSLDGAANSTWSETLKNKLNYKELFNIAMKLISSPAKAWEEISMEEDRRKVFMAFCLSYDWFMRFVRLYRLFADEWMGRTAKFSNSDDQLLCRSCGIVWWLLSGGLCN